MLFNKSPEQSRVPELVNVGRICPIFKGKGDKLDVKNHRPVTVLPCLVEVCWANFNSTTFPNCLKLIADDQLMVKECLPKNRLTSRTFRSRAAHHWNPLPVDVKSAKTLQELRTKLLTARVHEQN